MLSKMPFLAILFILLPRLVFSLFEVSAINATNVLQYEFRIPGSNLWLFMIELSPVRYSSQSFSTLISQAVRDVHVQAQRHGGLNMILPRPSHDFMSANDIVVFRFLSVYHTRPFIPPRATYRDVETMLIALREQIFRLRFHEVHCVLFRADQHGQKTLPAIGIADIRGRARMENAVYGSRKRVDIQ